LPQYLDYSSTKELKSRLLLLSKLKIQVSEKGMWFEMRMIKVAVFLALLFTVMAFVIDSTVPEGNLRSVLMGLSSGITILVGNLIAGNFKNKKRR
jgi:hypothetical protein